MPRTGAKTELTITSCFTNESWTGRVDLGEGSPEEKLRRAFRLFNRVVPEDERFLQSIGFTLPSMSAGDRVVMDGVAWKCAWLGWERDERDPSIPLHPFPFDD